MRIFKGFRCSFALALFSVCSAETYAAQRAPVLVEATGVTIGNGHVDLHIRFWNCTDKAITLDRRVLPWGQMATSVIVYKGAGIGKELDASYPVDDPPPLDVTISSGAYAAGVLNLDVNYPVLKKAKHPEDLVVFWVYDAKITEIPAAGKFGGMVPLLSAPTASNEKTAACK